MNAGLSNDQINKIFQEISQANACGPDCQRDNNIKDLEKQYKSAQDNIKTAPKKLYDAEKQYYVASEGTAGYNEMVYTRAIDTADKIGNELFKKFNELVNSGIELMNSFSNVNKNYQNLSELYDKLSSENKKLYDKIQNKESDIVTNDRKTFYENQKYDSSHKWHYRFLWAFYILLATYTIVYIMAEWKNPNVRGFRTHMFIIFLLMLYPYLSTMIFNVITEYYDTPYTPLRVSSANLNLI